MLFIGQARGMDVYWHRWLGVLSVALAVPCTLFAYLAERRRRKEAGGKGMITLYRTFLLLTVMEFDTRRELRATFVWSTKVNWLGVESSGDMVTSIL